MIKKHTEDLKLEPYGMFQIELLCKMEIVVIKYNHNQKYGYI